MPEDGITFFRSSVGLNLFKAYTVCVSSVLRQTRAVFLRKLICVGAIFHSLCVTYMRHKSFNHRGHRTKSITESDSGVKDNPYLHVYDEGDIL